MSTQLSRLTRGELTCWELRHRGQRLVIAEQGAQLLEYQKDGEPPLIWLSEEAAYQPGQGVRGGAPVCWPWFGGLAFNPESVQQQYPLNDPPAHGLVRTLPWSLVEQQLGDDHATLVFQLAEQADRRALPPVIPTLTVRLEDALTLTLNNENVGEQTVWISQALHSYFAVADSRQVSIHGLDQCPYIDALDNWQQHQQQGELRFTSETDRLYLSLPAQLHIDDPVWQRRITLETRGSTSAVVWNPWVDKSLRLGQFAADAWQRMLCIETARVLNDVLELPPASRHSMSVRFVTQPL